MHWTELTGLYVHPDEYWREYDLPGPISFKNFSKRYNDHFPKESWWDLGHDIGVRRTHARYKAVVKKVVKHDKSTARSVSNNLLAAMRNLDSQSYNEHLELLLGYKNPKAIAILSDKRFKACTPLQQNVLEKLLLASENIPGDLLTGKYLKQPYLSSAAAVQQAKPGFTFEHYDLLIASNDSMLASGVSRNCVYSAVKSAVRGWDFTFRKDKCSAESIEGIDKSMDISAMMIKSRIYHLMELSTELTYFAQALSGLPLNIKAAKQTYFNGREVNLPSSIQAENIEKAKAFYHAATAQQTGQIEFGTFDLNLDGLKTLVDKYGK
jgi:hypothetical protein